MIYLNLRGNLGNQMFEYAIARTLQEKYKQTICVNSYHIENIDNYKEQLHHYVLNENVIFEKKKRLRIIFNDESKIFNKIRRHYPKMIFNFFKHFGIITWHKETYIEFKNIKRKNYYIDGYFQSELYFNNIENVLKKEFIPKDLKEIKKIKIYKELKNNDYTGLIIRRGDYVKQYKEIYYVCNKKYYNKALKYLKNKNKLNKIMIISEEPNWAIKNLNITHDYIKEDTNLEPYVNLYLSSLCKKFIIANSSFAWWIQYLSNNKNKKVIAPSIWYKDKRKTNIHNKKWKLINVEK